jgi:hypothetical protein
MTSLTIILKTIIMTSVLFVWVVRYQNIIQEFKTYNYPDWLRDLVGILKITMVILIMNDDVQIVRFGAVGLCSLMTAAMITHLKIKNPIFKMLPSLTLFTLSFLVFVLS